MKEYTILAVISVFFTFLLDIKTRVRILKRREYYVFLLVIVCFKFLVNGYLTGSNIVVYNPGFFLGFRLTTIPFEDFLFGFSMVTMAVIFWEYYKKKSFI